VRVSIIIGGKQVIGGGRDEIDVTPAPAAIGGEKVVRVPREIKKS
jgi:hypothetical protein